MKRLLVAAACLCVFACSSSSPTSPTPTPTPTPPPSPTLQSVGLAANLGTLNHPGATAQVVATGTFSNGTSQDVTASCANWQSDNTFVLTVNGSGLMTAHNSGSSTVTASCQGVFARGLVTLTLPAPFVMSGSGNTVFDIPMYITRIHITGTYTGYTSNFIVRIGGQLVVNDLIGTGWGTTVSDGTYLTVGGTVQITNSLGVSWTFSEVR